MSDWSSWSPTSGVWNSTPTLVPYQAPDTAKREIARPSRNRQWRVPCDHVEVALRVQQRKLRADRDGGDQAVDLAPHDVARTPARAVDRGGVLIVARRVG